MSNNFNPHLNSFSRQYLYYLPVDLYKRTILILLFIGVIGRVWSRHWREEVRSSFGCFSRNTLYEELLRFCPVFFSVFSINGIVIGIKIKTNSITERCMSYVSFWLVRNEVSTRPFHHAQNRYIEVQINGNSFLYHQIRKMIGASIAVACGSWTMRYFYSCIW